MKELKYYEVFATAIGPLTVVVSEDGEVVELFTSDAGQHLATDPNYQVDFDRTRLARTQLEEYAKGDRKEFDLRLAPTGTDFQKRVWAELMKIPYGETRSYGELAASIGNPMASRAVGRANGTNPIGIVVPCHRVIGSTGGLTGYGGGLPMKRRLLELEGSIRPSLFEVE